jgi:hypothetical protein
MNTALESEPLSAARKKQLASIVKDLQLYSRRAQSPEDRVALAELEHELLEVERRWRETGLLPNGEQLELSHAGR